MPFVTVNGVKLNYRLHGEGKPVVLIGGLGSQISSWDDQVPLYSKRFRVLVFDNRGSGRSDKPEAGYGTEDMADDTAALMEALGIESAHVVGKSMGGMIGQWLAIKYPEKVDRLVLACSSASRDEVGNQILRMGRQVAESSGMKTVWLMALYLGYTRQYIERNIDHVKGLMESLPEDPGALAGYIGQSYACEGHHTIERLPDIKSPTLVMLGENDIIASPDSSRIMSELIPQAELEVFRGLGHGFWREAREYVDNLVLDFLSR